MAEHVVDFEEGLRVVSAHAARPSAPVTSETLPLLASRGRVLASAVLADRDHPPFDRSTRDGFAVTAASFSAGLNLHVAGLIRAGESWVGEPLGKKDAIQIMTGAPVPAGADAIAMVEHVVQVAGTVHAATRRTLASGDNIVPRASEARAGQTVLPAGVRIGAAEIALAAACGCAELTVYRRPRVAIVATGDELVELDKTPAAHQIRNSNSYAIAAMVEAAGSEPIRLAIVPDQRQPLATAIAEARGCDLIVLSGGVSMGVYDLVEEMLIAEGAQFLFTGVRMQPGKPLVFGRLPARADAPERYFFGLPGNPVSTQVTFHCFVEPLLRALCGEQATAPAWALATLSQEVAGKQGLTRVLPARLEGTSVQLVNWQGSGDLAANALANCYAELLPGVSYTPGEVIRILLR